MRGLRRLVRSAVPEVGEELARLRQMSEQVSASAAVIARVEERLAALEQHTVARDDRLDTLRSLVTQVEHYQPLYGVAGIIDQPARASRDRARAIERAMGQVSGQRVLDIGSSLGYMSFHLADRGARVTGWDLSPANVLVARAVGEINGLPVTFLPRELSHESVTAVAPGEYDAALVLAVLHHIIHFSGLRYAQELVRELVDRVPVLYLELAVKGEDSALFWDAAQPEDPREVLALVADDVEVETLGSFGTHLSTVERSLLKVTRRRAVTVNGRPYAYDRVTHRAYDDAPAELAPERRRYYHGPSAVVKEYGFSDDAPWNWQQIISELFAHATVEAHPGVHHVLHLRDAELSSTGARLVLDRVPGTLLDELAPVAPAALATVLRDVTTTLRDLAARGLHHNDVRSWNIVVGPDGGGWLIDYGLVTPVAVDDDLVALTWAAAAGLTGTREDYTMAKAELPPAGVFAGTPLAAWHAALAAGERDHDALCALLAPPEPEVV